MCFYIPGRYNKSTFIETFIYNKNKKSNVAKKDIPVFKIISNSNQPFTNRNPNLRFYEPNTLYRLGKPIVVELQDRNAIINEGFHSYASIDTAYTQISGWNYTHKVCRFIIPKGAKYYFNKYDDEYVSTSIRTEDLSPV